MATNNGTGFNGNGRPKITIDWKQFEDYCALQCTLVEIADYLDCSVKTLERKIKEHYGSPFSVVFRRKRQKGLMSLRANLFKLAQKQGNVAIFLAKNWLEMSDKTEVEHSGSISRNLEDYSTEELLAIAEGRSRAT